jgi:hypothetical protein
MLNWFLVLSVINPATPALVAGDDEPPARIRFEHVIIDRESPEEVACKAVGDLDGDGFADIVIAGYYKGGNLVWYQYPAWTKHVIKTGQFAVDMQVADMDGDRDLDVVVPDDFGGDTKGRTLVWYENPRPKGNAGTDKWKRHIITTNAPVDDYIHDVEVGDINRDGKLDVVVRHGKTVIYVRRTGDSWAEKIVDQGTGTGDEEGTTLADINGDGRLDIVLNGYWMEQPLDPVQGRWEKHVIDAGWPHLVGVTVADMNGDGRPDVLLAPAEQHGRLSWYEASRDPVNGPWNEHVIDPDVDYVHTFKVADMNLDGRPDVVAAEMHRSGYHPDKPSRRRVSVYLSAGRGLKWTQQVVAPTGSHNLRVADIDSDGDIDIVGANWSGPYRPVELWRNLVNSTKTNARLERTAP